MAMKAETDKVKAERLKSIKAIIKANTNMVQIQMPSISEAKKPPKPKQMTKRGKEREL